MARAPAANIVVPDGARHGPASSVQELPGGDQQPLLHRSDADTLYTIAWLDVSDGVRCSAS